MIRELAWMIPTAALFLVALYLFMGLLYAVVPAP